MIIDAWYDKKDNYSSQGIFFLYLSDISVILCCHLHYCLLSDIELFAVLFAHFALTCFWQFSAYSRIVIFIYLNDETKILLSVI